MRYLISLLTFFLLICPNCFAGEAPVSGVVLEVNIQLQEGSPIIRDISLKNGLNLTRPMKIPSGNLSSYHLTLVNAGGSSLFEMDFFFPVAKTIPPVSPGKPDDGHPSALPLNNPVISLVLPYYPSADLILIMEPLDLFTPIEKRRLDHIKKYPLTQKSAYPLPAPAQSGKFNVLIMASGYQETMNNFLNQANAIKSTLLDTEPFKSRSANINVHIHTNTSDLGCYSGAQGIARLLVCDDSKVISTAASSGYLYDEILVVHNTPTYSGSGYREDIDAYKTNSYTSYSVVYDGEYSAPMAIHEFGHSFGNLCDEYSYGSEGFSYSSCVNCRANCTDLADADTCQVGCDAKLDYYRPSDSIMLALNIPYFNDTSIYTQSLPDGLSKRLSYFTRVTTSNDNNSIHRFYNTAVGTHFYTSSDEEINNITNSLPHFSYEGIVFYGSDGTGTETASPVYRFYNKATGTHFYTIEEQEKDEIIAGLPEYIYEGEVYSAYKNQAEGTKALYRFYNTQTHTHFYTTSSDEKENIVATLPQYRYEGIAYYVK